MPGPDLLMPRPLPLQTVETLEREFTVHKLWEMPGNMPAPAIAAQARFMAAGGGAVISSALIQAFEHLEIIANFGVGYDSVDVSAAHRRGIVVTNTPDVLNEEVADLAMGLLLATVREIPQAERYLRAGGWVRQNYRLTRATLRGRTLGIVGLGRIGKAIARRAESFGLSIAYCGRNRQEAAPYPYYPTVLELAKAVDTLMLVVPGGEATFNIVNADVLRALGPEGVLINVARGTVVDETALVEALASGTIMAAGLDVYADEPHVSRALIDLENVVLLPHVGSASVATRLAMGQLVIDNLVSWRDGHGPLTPVPETPWPGHPASRQAG